MTLRVSLAALVVALAAPAFAGPPPAAPSPAAASPIPTDDMAAFDKDVNALFVQGGLTADEAAARSAKVSPTVKRKAAELDAQVAQLKAAELARVPQVSGKASYTRLSYIAPVNLGFGGMNFTIPFLQNSYDLQLNVGVPISDYFLTFPHLKDSAALGVQSARVGEIQSAVNAGQDARIAFYEWVRSRLQVIVANRQLEQVKVTLAQAQALADVQRMSKADLLRIVAQEADAEQTLAQLQLVAQLREEQLRILIGEPDAPLTIGEDIRGDIATSISGSLDELVKQAEAKRLDVRGIDLGIAAKDQQRASQQANLYPHLSAFATVEDARPNQRIFPQADEFRATWLAGVQLTWSLGDVFNYQTNSQRIAAETNELRADRANLMNGVRLDILSAEQNVELALTSLKTSQKQLAAAEEGYRVRKELLEAERATAVELVDAETELTRARITALNARVDLREALTVLGHALGEDVPGSH